MQSLYSLHMYQNDMFQYGMVWRIYCDMLSLYSLHMYQNDMFQYGMVWRIYCGILSLYSLHMYQNEPQTEDISELCTAETGYKA